MGQLVGERWRETEKESERDRERKKEGERERETNVPKLYTYNEYELSVIYGINSSLQCS